MEVKHYTNVNVMYIPSAGVLQIWNKEDGKSVSLGLFYVYQED